jgi:hypothetical protein
MSGASVVPLCVCYYMNVVKKTTTVIPSLVMVADLALSWSGSFFMSEVSICVAVGLLFGSNLLHDLKISSILLVWVFRSTSYVGS